MRGEPGHVLPRLGLDLPAQRLLLGVGGAGEEEVLPDQQAEFVAGVVELVALVESAAPDPDQVHARRDRLAEPAAVAGGVDPGGQHVVRDPVDAAGEDRRAVDDQREGAAPRVACGVQDDGAKADPAPPGVERCGAVEQGDLAVVERLFAVAAGPPQGGAGYLGGDGEPVRAGRRRGLDEGLAHLEPYGQRAAGAGRGTFQLHPDLDPAGAVGDRDQRRHGGEPGGGPVLDPDLLPDARGDQGRAPVPAEGAGHLADVLEGLGVRVRPVAEQRADPFGLGVGGGEGDGQRGAGGRVPPGDVEAVAAVHVPGGPQRGVAEPDVGDGVQPVEDQVGPFVAGPPGRQDGLVSPVGPSDPGGVGLVPVQERVREQAGGHQVGVHTARYGGGHAAACALRVTWQAVGKAQPPAVGDRRDVLHSRSLPAPFVAGRDRPPLIIKR